MRWGWARRRGSKWPNYCHLLSWVVCLGVVLWDCLDKCISNTTHINTYTEREREIILGISPVADACDIRIVERVETAKKDMPSRGCCWDVAFVSYCYSLIRSKSIQISTNQSKSSTCLWGWKWKSDHRNQVRKHDQHCWANGCEEPEMMSQDIVHQLRLAWVYTSGPLHVAYQGSCWCLSDQRSQRSRWGDSNVHSQVIPKDVMQPLRRTPTFSQVCKLPRVNTSLAYNMIFMVSIGFATHNHSYILFESVYILGSLWYFKYGEKFVELFGRTIYNLQNM